MANSTNRGVAASAKTSQQDGGFRKVVKGLLIVLGGLILLVGVILAVFAYDNLHYDEGPLRAARQAGFVEKDATVPSGTRIHYAEGPNNGPALLLIHGQAMAWQDYAKVLPALSTRYHVFAVDCHGHGQSSHDPSRYTCQAMGADFATFIDTVIGEPTVLSGHSSGGIVATWIAANHHAMVRGLIIEDSPFFSVLPEEMQNTFVWKNGFDIVHRYLNQTEEPSLLAYNYRNSYLLSMFGGLNQIIANAAVNFVRDHPGEPVKVWFVPHRILHGDLYMNQYDPLFGETFYTGSWFDDTDQADILRRVQCPAIYIKVITRFGKDGVLWAANDDADAARVESLLPNGRTILISNTGHDVKYDDPAAFSKICLDFLSEIR